jgi:hypothetical protein
MKRVFVVMLAAAFMLPAMYSCKKGANDPFLSLKSRAARIAGDWKITKATYTQISGTSTTTQNFDNGTVTEISGGSSSSGTYTWEYSIDKKGTYKFTRTITAGGFTDIYAEEGKWVFANKNKNEDLKNKEMVCFQSTRRTYTSGSTTNIYTEEGNEFDWLLLDKLSSKEILATYSNTWMSGSTSNSVTAEITFTTK